MFNNLYFIALIMRGMPGKPGNKVSIPGWWMDSAREKILNGMFSLVRSSLFPNVSARNGKK